jgi:RNA polymerase sigma-70 factor (ECF subfamily)
MWSKSCAKFPDTLNKLSGLPAGRPLVAFLRKSKIPRRARNRIAPSGDFSLGKQIQTKPAPGACMIDWDELVRREGPGVWRAIYRIVRNSSDADECLQETFVAALKFAERQQVDCLPALLKRLAIARAVDCLRRRVRRTRREETVDVAALATGSTGPQMLAEAAELADELRWALAKIPARSAEVFCLHELEGWTYEQIGVQCSLSGNAVGALLHRTKKKLRDLLSSTKSRRT